MRIIYVSYHERIGHMARRWTGHPACYDAIQVGSIMVWRSVFWRRQLPSTLGPEGAPARGPHPRVRASTGLHTRRSVAASLQRCSGRSVTETLRSTTVSRMIERVECWPPFGSTQGKLRACTIKSGSMILSVAIIRGSGGYHGAVPHLMTATYPTTRAAFTEMTPRR